MSLLIYMQDRFTFSTGGPSRNALQGSDCSRMINMRSRQVFVPLCRTLAFAALSATSTIPFRERTDLEASSIRSSATDTVNASLSTTLSLTIPKATTQSDDDIKQSKVNDCHDTTFFDPTAANWEASGAGQFYVDWVNGYDKSSDKWKNKNSEVELFAHDYLTRPDQILCGVMQCDGMPSCAEVLNYMENDKEEARRVFFILQSIKHVNLFTRVVDVRPRSRVCSFCGHIFTAKVSY